MRAMGGEVVETPLPPEYREKLIEATERMEESGEALHHVGVSLIEVLYMSFGMYRTSQQIRKQLGDLQREICTAAGLDIDLVQEFDTERGTIISVKKAKPN